MIRLLNLLSFFILLLLTGCSGCEELEEPTISMKFTNGSSEKIVIGQFESRQAFVVENENDILFNKQDSVWSVDPNERLYMVHVSEIESGKSINLMFAPNTYPNYWSIIRVFKASTLERYTKEELIEQDICDKRYLITGDVIRKGNIVYTDD